MEKNQILNTKQLDEKSNNEILFEMKKMEAEHEALKLKMLNDYDKMIEMEKAYKTANEIILKRLKGR